jgi:hypothetical protein
MKLVQLQVLVLLVQDQLLAPVWVLMPVQLMLVLPVLSVPVMSVVLLVWVVVAGAEEPGVALLVTLGVALL